MPAMDKLEEMIQPGMRDEPPGPGWSVLQDLDEGGERTTSSAPVVSVVFFPVEGEASTVDEATGKTKSYEEGSRK